MARFRGSCAAVVLSLCAGTEAAAPGASRASPVAVQEHEVSLKDFAFASGRSLPELRIHYRTVGEPRRDAQGKVANAVLVLHGTTGSGAQFIRPEFSGALFGPGQVLDASRYFIVLPDGIGHGRSSKPSDGLHARFPNYGYLDMIEAQRRMLAEGAGVTHLRLGMGTSMGGMHTWLWGEVHPKMADALFPLASLPTQVTARLPAINTADDLINPPELHILEREIHRVPRGRAMVLPLGERTRGHGSHTVAALWKDQLEVLLRESAR